MKLIYISNSRMPSEYAHGLQVMQMCEAFMQNECEVELVIPRRINPVKGNIFSYYNVKNLFIVKKLPCLDLIFINSRNIFFGIQTFTFLLFAKAYLLLKKYDVLYTREQMVVLFFKDVVLEIHSLPKKIKPFHIYLWKRTSGLVVLTSFIKKSLIEAGVQADKIFVAPDGVNLSMFNISISKVEARKKLNLLHDKKLLGYVGMLRTLGMEKGIDVAIKALAEIKNNDVVLVLVGGHKDDIDYYITMATKLGVKDRVIFVGRANHSQIPIYLKAFDVLLAPFPENEHYSYYMSPMKIFEYMASNRPIVSTELPSIREALGDSAILVKPGDVISLRDGIIKILEDSELAESLSKKAYTQVLEYTWNKRAKNILRFIK